MEEIISHESNLPNDASTSPLEKCTAKIARLRAEIARECARMAELEKASTTIRPNSSAVNRLPTEILSRIFFEVMKLDQMAIGIMFLVCHRWYNIAYNTPTLFTRIHSNLRPDPSQIDRLTCYIQTAIKFSMSLPLTVTIHLPSINDLWTEMATKFFSNPPWKKNRNDADAAWRADLHEFSEWIERVTQVSPGFNFGDWIYRECSPFRTVSDALHAHLDALLGAEGENIKRISSLTVHFDSKASVAWNNPRFPQGSLLRRLNATPECFSLIDKSMDWYMPPVEAYARPNPNLRRLSWGVAHSPEVTLMTEGQLVDLRMIWCERVLNIGGYTLPSPEFTRNLQCLYLHLAPGLLTDIIIAPTEIFTFPVLEDLAISGTFDASYIEALNAPSLQSLRLLFSRNPIAIEKVHLQSLSQFSSIKRFHIYNDLTYHQITFEDILKIFPRIRELGILGDRPNKVREALQKMDNNDVAVKGYIYSSDCFWRLDETYEDNQVVID